MPVSAPMAVWRRQNTPHNHLCTSSFSRSTQTFAELAQRENGCDSHSKCMSITGSSSGDACIASRSSWACTNFSPAVGGPLAEETGGGSSGSPWRVRDYLHTALRTRREAGPTG